MMAAPQPRRPEDASAARTPLAAPSPASPAPRPGPICVHLTPFAPGCEKQAISSPRRNAAFYGKTLDQVLRATLRRCGVAPGAVRVEAEVSGDINLLAPVPPELVALQSSEPGVPVPYAVIWEGAASAAEVAQALEALRARGWTPHQPPISQHLIGA